METVNFENEVIMIHENIVIVIDDFENLYFVDNEGIENAYEIGECVNSKDLSPLSALDETTKNTILDLLN
ncbi:MAG: hypothetical protein NC548_33685 [Lachnospiraceae bacterium]|nr:hypothetical protein [Lachnospiraceae bacterium]